MTVPYTRVLGKPGNHWSWQCLEKFLGSGSERSAIFAGLSLADPNLRLWLALQTRRCLEDGESANCSLLVVGPLPAASERASLEARRREIRWRQRVLHCVDEMLLELGLIPLRLDSWHDVGPFLATIEERILPNYDLE